MAASSSSKSSAKGRQPRKKRSNSEPRLIVRPMQVGDIEAVQALHLRVYTSMQPWTREQIENHLQVFPEGQLVIELDGAIVAVSSSLILTEEELEKEHTYDEICPDGFLNRHDPEGNVLYGIDVAVDPDHRGLRLARRNYDARKEIVRQFNLKSIVFGGRMPGYLKHSKELSPREYVRRVVRKELRDPVITAQRANGFVVRGILPGYLPEDKASCGHAVQMEWANPDWTPDDRSRPANVRISVVQYEMRPLASFEEFMKQCEFFIDTASEHRSDFVVFPELLTNQLLALVPATAPSESARKLDQFTREYGEFFAAMAIKYNVNVIAGTHLMVENDTLFNVAHLFHRDGRIDKQYKLHITPSESRWWGVSPGKDIHVFDTDSGRVAIAICYDVEFPELIRAMKQRGAELLFVPYNTDIRSGHLRVRACAQARAVENHMYVITAGATGNLPQVEGADIHYAQSAILTPCDIAFSRDGIATEATPNTETMLVHDLDLAVLRKTQATGTVRTWLDRRKDLYRIEVNTGKDTLKF